jgi:hypothetical protein
MRRVMAGPEWLECLSALRHYKDDIAVMDDEMLKANSWRLEVEHPPTDPERNDRDWRTYRRFIRQEMHRRGLKTPSKKPDAPCW